MNLKNKAIILNAPKEAGKNVIADRISELTGASHSEFKQHLYDCTATLFNVPREFLLALLTDRITKEVPSSYFVIKYKEYKKLRDITKGGVKSSNMGDMVDIAISPREALIYTSEIVIKPRMGDSYFGKVVANNIDTDKGVVFSDGGFIEEVEEVQKKVGKSNLYVVQFSRRGTSFDGDSRSYLNTSSGVNTLVTTNNKTIDDIVREILDWVGSK